MTEYVACDFQAFLLFWPSLPLSNANTLFLIQQFSSSIMYMTVCLTLELSTKTRNSGIFVSAPKFRSMQNNSRWSKDIGPIKRFNGTRKLSKSLSPSSHSKFVFVALDVIYGYSNITSFTFLVGNVHFCQQMTLSVVLILFNYPTSARISMQFPTSVWYGLCVCHRIE